MAGPDTVKLDWNAVAALARGEAPADPAAAPGPTLRPEAKPAEADPVAAPTVVTRPASPESTAGPDALAALLDTPPYALREPLAVDSAIAGRIFLVANEGQARAVRAEGGVPYTPAEVAILRETRAAVSPEEWPRRLRAIHAVKLAFEGEVC